MQLELQACRLLVICKSCCLLQDSACKNTADMVSYDIRNIRSTYTPPNTKIYNYEVLS